MLAILLQDPITPNSWAALGVGGVLALITFLFYREDRKADAVRWQNIANDFKSIIINNTEAMTELVTLVRNAPR